MCQVKLCRYCEIEKDISEFSKSKNLKCGCQNKCKLCTSKYNKERYLKNPSIAKENAKKWVLNNPDRRKQINSNYQKKVYNKDIDISREKNRKYKKKEWKNKSEEDKKKHYKKNNDNRRKRCDKNPLNKIKYAIRSNISKVIKRKGYTKKSKSYEILSCNYIEFKLYIELLWEDWMNWDNYGLYNGEFNYGWDLDHIIPVSSAKNEEDVIKLNHYTNFQPLCSHINRDIKRG